MAGNFYTILTATGKAKLANSAVLGSKVNFKTLKVGDGKGSYNEPSENQTSLVNQVWSGNISSISVDENNPNWIVIETLIPATIGGFFIREAGIFDEDDDLIAISKLSETYKPVVSEGSIKDLCIKIILEVSNVESVTLKIDPTVIVATKKDIRVLESKIASINSELYTPIYSDPITTDKEVNNIDVNKRTQIAIGLQGKTVVNLLNRNGDCEDLSIWKKIFGSTTALSLSNANKAISSSSIKLGTSATVRWQEMAKDISNIIDKSRYYCLSGYLKNETSKNAYVLVSSSDGTCIKKSDVVTDTDSFKRIFVKLQPSDLTNAVYVGVVIEAHVAGTIEYGYADGLMLEEITSSQYSDSNFIPSPYVNSDYSVGEVTTKIKTRSKNIGGGYLKVAYTNSVVNYSIAYDMAFTRSLVRVPVEPNKQYTFSCSTANRKEILFEDNSGCKIAVIEEAAQVYNSPVWTFSTPSNCSMVTIYYARIDDYSLSISEPTNVQLEEGVVATSYESYIGTDFNIQYPLRSLPDNTRDEIKNGKYIKRIEKLVLDLYYNYGVESSSTGYKKISITGMTNINVPANNGGLILKYTGKSLRIVDSNGFNNADVGQVWSDNTMRGGISITVANADSGWGDNYTPSVEEIRAYFLGYMMYNSSDGKIYNGTGNKAWINLIHLGDGNYSTTTLPKCMAIGYTPYRIYYKLANPIIIDIDQSNLIAYENNCSLVMESTSATWIRPIMTYTLARNEKASKNEMMRMLHQLNSNLSNSSIIHGGLNADLLDGLHSIDIIRKYDLNAINIDITDGSWYTSISENGHGTTPWGGWIHVIQYATPHFYTQIANTVNSDPTALTGMAVRTKWLQSGAWTAWRAIPIHQRASNGMNADDLTDTGIYSGSWGAGVPTSYPGYCDNQGVLQVINYWNLTDSKWVRQMFYVPHNDLIFERARVNGSWSAWKPLATTETATITQFYNGWTRWSDTNQGTDLTKCGKLVNLSILVTSPSPNQNTIFYLPEGYRPRKYISKVICGIYNGGLLELRIAPSGEVWLTGNTAPANCWIGIQETFAI